MTSLNPGPLPPAGESPEPGRALRSSVAAPAPRFVSPARLPSLDSGGLASGRTDPGGGLGGAPPSLDLPALTQLAAAPAAPAAPPADADMLLSQPSDDASLEPAASAAGRGRGRPRGGSGASRSSTQPGRALAAAASRLPESWGRLQNDDDWFLGDNGDSYEDPDEEGRLQLPGPAPPAPAPGPRGRPTLPGRGRAKAMARITTQRPPAPRTVAQARAAAAGSGEPALSSHAVRQLVSDMLASFGSVPPSAFPLPPPSAPGPSAPPLGVALAPGHVGLFRAIRELDPAGPNLERAPTAEELRAVPIEALRLLFCDHRVAEITRPRDPADDVKAAAAVKAGKTLTDAGWSISASDREALGILYGFQACFRPGQSPVFMAQLLAWAVPFGLDRTNDISKSTEWTALRVSAMALLPRLEAEVHGCRNPDTGQEFPMPSSLLTQIRALAEQHFRHIAAALRPLLAVLGTSVLEEHAKTVVRAYMAQAVALPIAWENLENLLVSGALAEHGKDSAVAENAARVVMARAALVALLHGQAKNWATQEMVQAHLLHRPSPVFLRSTEFTQLSATCAKAAAALAASFRLPGGGIPSSAPTRNPGPRAALSAHDTSLGFLLSALGQKIHPLYFSGEYPVPAGWLPPPRPVAPGTLMICAPPPSSPLPAAPRASGRTTGSSPLCIPAARSMVAASSPFTDSSQHPCEYCQNPGHAQYECPRRFADVFGQPLPGFLSSGDRDPAAWSRGDLTSPARAAMAKFFLDHSIPPHRRFRVTADHIRFGTAPPPPP
jgi:hypothetical protein